MLPVALLVLGLANQAAAQGSAAEALFEEGRKALAAGDLDTACARFRASDKIDPAPGTKANLAECEEKRGHVATAWELNRTALNRLPADDARAAPLKQRIAKLEPRLPKLVLRLADGAPQDTAVSEGAVQLGAAGGFDVPLPLDPGVHHLTITARSHPAKTVDVTLTEGKTETLTVEPAIPEAKVTPEKAPAKPPEDDGPGAGPWVIGGIGLAALIGSAVTGGLVLKAASATGACADTITKGVGVCQTPGQVSAANSAAGTINTLGPATTVLMVVGGAGVAAGAIWLGVAKSSKPSARIGVGPTVGGAAWRMEGAW
jgi:hypothetical protein